MSDGGAELFEFDLGFLQLREFIAKSENDEAVAGLGGDVVNHGREFGDGREVLGSGELIDECIGRVKKRDRFRHVVDRSGRLNEGRGLVLEHIDRKHL